MELSLRPLAASPGATLELSFDLQQVTHSLTSIQIMMGDSALGAPIAVVDGSTFSVRRTVPDLPPANYEVIAVSDGQVLAAADFEVLDLTESGSSPMVLIGLTTVVLGLGWQAARGFYRSTGNWTTLGPVDLWYTWRERRRR